MFQIFQTTLAQPVEFCGIGLHSGKKSCVKILPANSNTGIIFKRVDLNENNIIEANYLNVRSSKLCTTLENKFGTQVSTVEHLLAAIYIAEIDNAIIEINSCEVPIMDGSAKNFLDGFKQFDLKIFKEKRKFLKILNKVQLKDNDREISIEPINNSFEVDFEIKYENKIIGNQKNVINFQNDNIEEVSKSRTFCLYKDIEKIKKVGLAKGGSLDNAIVVDENKILNEGGLRNDNEFVNHKILDLAGDFLLSNYRIIGKVICKQGGHELSNKFLRKLLKMNSSFKIFESDNILVTQNQNIKKTFKLAVNA